MWSFLARRIGVTPNLERRVAALEHAHRIHEDYARDKALSIEADINILVAGMNNIRAELEAERRERFKTIMDGFSEASEGIVSRVLASVWSEMGISRADMRSMKERISTLELRGDDGK